ncbi:hypothetical protein AURANDRAFT_21801 [Aureococcus anophagefferens]|uniref:Coronin n=1 Tax=Aureococcus anophagefferens TaxID=44056 RepID=F0Y2I0_AURAN|nr:hypothetical protein AURANDRAFT_21801 [Aureococcus anophagefferens]EGB11069.1 hypothetical protein AURANDRAFT_21801 [Aureococcus anophagefferens]|eukprot:XP_009034623.1 hypothetical protein AURANDRAFT_21801 [Aureococcus anophagefferens]
MSGFVRSSHYRHVFVDPPKVENTYKGFRLATVTGEQQYIKGNTKFFAVALQGGGGPFAVVPYGKKGQFAPGTPVVAGHKSAVLDFDFNPFHEHIIASASEDSTIKVWGIPPDGLTETITEPLVDLHGHGRKVTLLRFHPTANNVLGSVSGDFSVKVWDIEKGCEVSGMPAHEQLIQDLVWDYEGKMWATTCKDKKVRLGDPRAGAVAMELPEAHAGAKSVKMTFLGDTGRFQRRFATVGFTKQSQRQIKVWDVRDLSKMVHKVDLDQAAGVIVPYYDCDTKVLYLCGKGDGNIRYYEMSKDKPFAFALSEYRSTQAAKGSCFLPKRGLNVMACETARCLKLTSQNGNGIVEPLSFIVPRKSDAFQDDIFPDTFSGHPSCTADEWLSGVTKTPLMMSLNPDSAGAKPTGGATKAFVPMKTPAALQKEIDEKDKRIALLEARLKAAGLDCS